MDSTVSATSKWRLCRAAIVILFLGLIVPAWAQQAHPAISLLPEDAARGLNGPQHNFDFVTSDLSGEKYHNAGFFGQKLRPYLAGNAEALSHLNKYRHQKTLYLIDRLVAVGAFGLYGQQILAHGERVYFNSTQQAALGVFATSIIATVFINRNTNTHFLRAVSAYRTDVVRSNAWSDLLPSSVGFAAAPNGQPLVALRWALR